MSEIIEMGKISSRGQVAIPTSIRDEMNLKKGNKVLFILEDDSLLVKKITSKTFAEITEPLKKAAKKARMKEKDVR